MKDRDQEGQGQDDLEVDEGHRGTAGALRHAQARRPFALSSLYQATISANCRAASSSGS